MWPHRKNSNGVRLHEQSLFADAKVFQEAHLDFLLTKNLSTIAPTACQVGRLLRPKIGVSALKVATTDSESR